MTNAEKFKEVFGYDGSIVSDVKPGKNCYRSFGSCGYDECRDSCASRCFPRCPLWWNDTFKPNERSAMVCFEVKNNTVHLCESCSNTYPECNAESIGFGDGEGNDNVCCCSHYEPLIKRNEA